MFWAKHIRQTDTSSANYVSLRKLNTFIYIIKMKLDPTEAEPHFQENKVKLGPTEAEPSFQEKETLKTRRRFENSHVRVAQQQFRTAYRIDRSSANLVRRTITPCKN